MSLPGARLLAVARLVVDPVAVIRVLEPLVADWQREWLAAGSSWRRATARVRGLFAFLVAGAYCFVTSQSPPAVRRQAWLTLVLFAGLGSLIAVLPYLVRAEVQQLGLLAWLLPSSFLISLPFAALPVAIRLGAAVDRPVARRACLLRLALAIAMCTFLLHNWIVPHANQAFREHITFRAAEQAGKVATYRPPRRGLRELTLPEVFVESFSSPSAIASPSKVREELFRRMTLPLVSVLLAMLGWGLARVSSSAKPVRLFGWWVFGCVTYGFAISLGMTLENFWSVPREVATWLPLALWSTAVVVLMRSTRNAAGGAKSPPLPMQGTYKGGPSDS